MNKKNTMKSEKLLRAFKFIVLYCMLLIFYVAFLALGHAIPRSLVADNARESYKQWDSQGLYFDVVEGATWDGLTDAFFINTAVTEYDGNLVEEAIANAYTTTVGQTGWQWRGILDGILAAVDGTGQTVVESYSRYWAGMVTVYKFLLIFMPLSGIRTLVFGIAVILFAITVINIYGLLGKRGLIPFLTSVTLALYMPQAMCLVFSTDIIIMLLMMNLCFALLKRNASTDTFCIMFFLAGSILAYLNYWAFPLITLGFPLVLFVTVKMINKYDRKALIKEVFLISFSWAAGLAGTILAKQILCRIVLGAQNGTSRLLFRMGAELSMEERLVSVFNGFAIQIARPLLIITIIVVTIWSIALFKTNKIKRKYQCSLLVLIAFYPVVWWFLLANHSSLGFVGHMYGITYYALSSALLFNCEGFIPLPVNVRSITGKRLFVDIAVMGVWIIFSYLFLNAIVHYGTVETKPWSLETMDTVNLGQQTVTQEVSFDELTTGRAYLKGISTILVNIPDDKKEGVLCVEIAENGNVLSTGEIPIEDVEIGEWFQIPIECMIYLGHKYEISYFVKKVNDIEPYLLVQDDSQAARENGVLYVDGVSRLGAIANEYEYDNYILSAKPKISIIFIILFILQYIIFLFTENRRNEQQADIVLLH